MTRPMKVEHLGNSGIDAYGNASQAVTSTELVTGYIEPMSEVLQLNEQQTFTTTYGIVLPLLNAPLTASDRITVDYTSPTARPFGVIEAMLVTNARTGQPHHIEGRVQEQRG